MEKDDLAQGCLGCLGIPAAFLIGGILSVIGVPEAFVGGAIALGIIISGGLTFQSIFFIVTNPIDDTIGTLREIWWDIRGKSDLR